MRMNEHIAEALRAYRLANLLTFEALSEKTGIPPSTLRNIVAGRHEASELTIAKLQQTVPTLFEADGNGIRIKS